MADREKRVNIARFFLCQNDEFFNKKLICTDEKLWNLDEALNRSKSFFLAEVYIERSAIITKGEKGREMWQIFFGL